MTMITPSYLGETIEYSSLHACRSTLEDPTFAALSMGSRNREFLLSLILFPIFIPALLAMVQATTSIFTGDSDPMLWIKLLLGYDVIFTTVSLLLFDVVLHAE